jgi:NAD+ synthase
MSSLDIDCERVREALCDFIRTEVARAGLAGAVVNLSGGVDSAVSTFLTAQALGPQHVLVLLLPYRSTSPDSLADAREIVDKTGIEALEVDITPMVDAYFERFPDADRVRRGNKMARERMSIAYDISAARRAMVIGTGNKTEALLGYTTLWGDMACGINPIGDLYKTQVRQLARHLGVPERIIAKPPSAGLWPGQTDEGEMGVTYAEADQVLHLLVDEAQPSEEVVRRGFEPGLVRRVQEMMRASEFKRRMPLVAKIPR